MRNTIAILIPLHTAKTVPPHPRTHRGVYGNIPWNQQGGFFSGLGSEGRRKQRVQNPKLLFPSTQPCCVLLTK